MPEADITQLDVLSIEERRRVHVQVAVLSDLDPSPYLQLSILDPDGAVVSEMLVMGTSEPIPDITLHLRPAPPPDEARPYTLRGRLFYGEEGEEEETLDTKDITFHLSNRP